jgi:O-antigen/teichoic acid export membrane protein
VELGRKLARNTGFVFISEIMNKLFSLCFIAYAARVLGPENFGFYALLGTITFIFFFFANAGIGPMAVREISRDKSKAKELFNFILSLKVTLVLCAYPILVLIINILGYKEDFKYLVYISGFSAVFSVFSHSFGVLYVAYEQFKIPAIASIIVAFLSNLCNIIVLYPGYGLKGLYNFLLRALFEPSFQVFDMKRIIKFKFALI